MTVIYRYQLAITDEQVLDLPLTAQILHVAPDRTGHSVWIDLWAMVPEEASTRPTTIWIFGTGNPIPNGLVIQHVGTCVMPNGLVWHVFIDRSGA